MYQQQFAQQQFQQPQMGFAPQFGQPMYGASVMPAQTMFKEVQVTNPMTKEDLELLKPVKNEFNMNIDPVDVARAKCPHKNATKLLINPIGGGNMVKCSQCGAEFDLTIRSKEDIEASVNNLVNFLEQMKLYAVNFDEEFYKDYMMMIPLLRKAPNLYEMAVQNFTEVVRQTSNSQTVAPNANPAFNRFGFDAYQDIFNGNYGARYNVYNQQQPVMPMAQPMAQPGYYDPNMVAAQQAPQMQVAPQQGQVFGAFTQAPQQAPVMQPAPQMGNPFANGYAAPVMTAPMAMQQAPQMQAPVAQQPAAPAPAENVTTETKVTL
jgi:hypothetical protein